MRIVGTTSAALALLQATSELWRNLPLSLFGQAPESFWLLVWGAALLSVGSSVRRAAGARRNSFGLDRVPRTGVASLLSRFPRLEPSQKGSRG
jgi:hypothetical protein